MWSKIKSFVLKSPQSAENPTQHKIQSLSMKNAASLNYLFENERSSWETAQEKVVPKRFLRFAFKSYRDESRSNFGGFSQDADTGSSADSMLGSQVEYPIMTDDSYRTFLDSSSMRLDTFVNQRTFEPRNSSWLSERNIVILSAAAFLGIGLYLCTAST